MKLLVAIHGICTGQTNASWPDLLDAWFSRRDPEIRVLKKEYRAGPFPRWNNWVKDPRLAKALANEIELFAGGDAATGDRSRSDRPEVWFVSHSNGSVIALRTIERLVARGWTIGGSIFTGAAIEEDVDANGVLRLTTQRKLGRAISWSSKGDAVVDGKAAAGDSWRHRVRDLFYGKLMWPYGSLGRTGWLWHDRPYQSASIWTRWCPVYFGHGGYWRAEHLGESFEAVYQTMRGGAK